MPSGWTLFSGQNQTPVVDRRKTLYCFRTVIFVVSTRTPALCRALVNSSEVMNPSTTSIEGVSITR